jgi:WD40 repeat protein
MTEGERVKCAESTAVGVVLISPPCSLSARPLLLFQFHPIEDRYFVSGSFDKKLRIWNIPEHRVVEWAQTSAIITSATFSPNGNLCLAGLYNGQCVFYQTDGLKYHTQVDAKNRRGRNSKGKKVTGMQFSPDGKTLLVTTNDSRIRLFDLDAFDMVAKFKGTENDEVSERGERGRVE